MRYALISPVEPCESGYRVAEVVATPFEVAPPLFWAECSDEVVADLFWYDPATSQFYSVPEPEPMQYIQPTVSGAQAF